MSLVNSKNIVWNFFKFDEAETVKVKCNLCSLFISRGGTGKKASTTPLLNHLKNKHKKEYAKLNASSDKDRHLITEHSEEVDDPNTSSKRKRFDQPTLEAVLDKIKIWDINHPKSVELHQAIGMMIAVDNQPYSFVEDEGFRNLMFKAQPKYNVPSREYFKHSIIPNMYLQCKKHIESLLSSSKNISVTTDMWTNSVNKDSFISFTAHWVDLDYNYRHYVLNVKDFPGSHNSENISQMLHNLIKEWKLDNKIYLVLRDNGPNIVKGVNTANLKSESCFLHNLHLIVTDALNSQRAIKDMVAIGRHIVGHFNHSSAACTRFKQIQEEQLHSVHKKLVQDVQIRWNSIYYMLARLLELKKCSINIYAAENKDISNFSSYQWTLMENCVNILKPFEEITKQISSSKSLISEVIPMIATLNRYLLSSEVKGIGTMKDTLEGNIKKRFSMIHQNEHFSISTILDPRFKTRFFDVDKGEDEIVKSNLLSLMKSEVETLDSPKESEEVFEEKETKNNKSIWDCFAEITKQTGPLEVKKDNLYEQELSRYLLQPVIERKVSPFDWWKKNHDYFPNLSKLIKKHLSPPASSIYSERMFSEAGIVFEKKHNRLQPKNAEQLLFLHHNLPLLKQDKNT